MRVCICAGWGKEGWAASSGFLTRYRTELELKSRAKTQELDQWCFVFVVEFHPLGISVRTLY